MGLVGHGDRRQPADERGHAQGLGVGSEVGGEQGVGRRDVAALRPEMVEVGSIGPPRRRGDACLDIIGNEIVLTYVYS